MSVYYYFQKKHPEWPKRLAEADGRMVKLKVEMQTNGGEVFPIGTVMRISGNYRGHLRLIGEDRRYMTRVHKHLVELLPREAASSK